MKVTDFSLLSDVLNKATEKKFLDAPLHQKAKADFRYLCMQLGHATLNDCNSQLVKTTSAELGSFLSLGHKVSERKIEIPKDFVDTEKKNQYIAVVGYKEDDTVADVYVFKASEFKKTGFFSIYKFNKKTDMYTIALPKPDKLKTYSFGYVFKNFIN